MLLKAAIIILLYLAAGVYSHDNCFYPTQFDAAWLRKCPRRAFVSHLVSSFQSKFNDRMWMVCCRKLPTRVREYHCDSWTDYANKFSAELNFVCPKNMFIAGMASRHSDHIEDRRYKFRCCSSEEIRLRKCKQTETLNEMGRILNFNVTSGRVITGIRGTFSTENSDRQFQATTCEIKK